MDTSMRRKDRQIGDDEARALLAGGEYGILAINAGDGPPYQVPLSYAVSDDRIYFHCAGQGRKLDCLRADGRVCFGVVGATQPVYDNGYSTYYESVLVTGAAKEVTDEEEKLSALHMLTEKYLSGHMEHFAHEVERYRKVTQVWAIEIDQISGKAKRSKV